ncbi:MAG: DUF4339 domain-containing protein [Bradyrhizobium sp.]|uniref:DUF4339 domain-containing protein n=1 Tax=Bradyrhizobium sp. TaxID=376 RepID=UPI001D8820F3|nr:DUF4339 domain-containing protein [Bradyrhizobium sp.]MBV9563966.1 DUF4339 domain-containing protein [Bradyrhizobium sp.]
MPDRSWFFAAAGQQQGPYPDAQFRDFIARGAVTAQTLVWTEGMSGWQKAGDIPGLFSRAARPPAPPRNGTPAPAAAGAPMAAMGRGGAAPMVEGGYGDGSLSIDLPLWGFFGRCILFGLGILLVIPAPWAATYFYRWIVERLRVPGRPNLSFTGQVGDIWYVFVAIGLCSYSRATGSTAVQLVVILLQAFLAWMALKWVAGNIAANGQRLPVAFTGSALGYIGWYVLMFVSLISIIGWAWVISAWMRWICRNVDGTHREIVFNGSGLDILWRTLAFSFGSILIIPIPWLLRWYTQWYASQFALEPREGQAAA